MLSEKDIAHIMLTRQGQSCRSIIQVAGRYGVLFLLLWLFLGIWDQNILIFSYIFFILAFRKRQEMTKNMEWEMWQERILPSEGLMDDSYRVPAYVYQTPPAPAYWTHPIPLPCTLCLLITTHTHTHTDAWKKNPAITPKVNLL